MIKLPFFQKKKEKRFICLDIGTESAKVLICSFRKSKQEKIITVLGSSFEYFDNFGVFESKDFAADIIKKTILEAVKKARLNFLRNFNKEIQIGKKWPVFISAPPNILKAKIFFQFFNRQNPERVIDKKEERVICNEVLSVLQSKVANLFSEETGILPGDIHFVNLKLLEIKIDGYEVPVLRGYEGTEVKFRILSVFLGKQYLKTIENIAKEAGFYNIKIVHPAEVISNFLTEKSSGVFLDVGGSLTQIILVNNGKLEKIDIFEAGGKDFSREISRALGFNTEQSRLLKEKYYKRLFTEGARKKIKEIFSQPSREWFKALKSKISEDRTFIPSAFYLYGGGSLLPEIQEILEQGDWKDFPIIPPPEVKYIFPNDFKNIADSTKTVNSPKEINPILICSAIL